MSNLRQSNPVHIFVLRKPPVLLLLWGGFPRSPVELFLDGGEELLTDLARHTLIPLDNFRAALKVTRRTVPHGSVTSVWMILPLPSTV
jgi:hypothetical protein